MRLPVSNLRDLDRLHRRADGDGSSGGTGIGRAIVAKSIERLGGYLGVESAPGNGSNFWFELPAVEALPLEKDPERVRELVLEAG